jgi:glycyl-tRNA synthetase
MKPSSPKGAASAAGAASPMSPSKTAGAAAGAPQDLEQLRASVTQAKSTVRRLKAEGADGLAVLSAVQAMKVLDEQLKKAEAALRGPSFDSAGLQDVLLRRMIVVPAFEIHGGVSGLYDFGPVGCALKDNIVNTWKKHFVLQEKMLPVECTCLTAHSVLKASGHVDRFTDLMVKDDKSGVCYRADKLLEDHIEGLLLKNPAMPQAEREELELCARQADAYSPEELGALINERFKIVAPDTGNVLSAPFPFNLMFKTLIGPEGTNVGYLRPETAQGIFVNFKRLLEFNGGKLPFAAAQVGLGFRNEIAPRNGLIRVREFTMAEIEHFCHPLEKQHPKFDQVKDYVLTLFPSKNQLTTGKTVQMTAGAAVAGKVIANETLAYFLCRTAMFFDKVGVDMARLRFRQHLPTEMAHYSSDCWDGEIRLSFGWVECVGHADRSAYDLQVHSKATKVDLTAIRRVEPPEERVYAKVTADKKVMGKKLKSDAGALLTHIESIMPVDEAVALGARLAKGETVTVQLPTAEGCKPLDVSPDMMSIVQDSKMVHTETFTPNVIEPSFGIGRVLHAVLEHSFYLRSAGEGEEAGEDSKVEKGTVARTCFKFSPLVAPVKVGVCFVRKVPEQEALVAQITDSLVDHGLYSSSDTSSTAIGRKYARFDEIGIPFCITVDPDTIVNGSVTVRERDSCEQVRVASVELAKTYVAQLSSATIAWDDIVAKHGLFTAGATA